MGAAQLPFRQRKLLSQLVGSSSLDKTANGTPYLSAAQHSGAASQHAPHTSGVTNTAAGSLPSTTASPPHHAYHRQPSETLPCSAAGCGAAESPASRDEEAAERDVVGALRQNKSGTMSSSAACLDDQQHTLYGRDSESHIDRATTSGSAMPHDANVIYGDEFTLDVPTDDPTKHNENQKEGERDTGEAMETDDGSMQNSVELPCDVAAAIQMLVSEFPTAKFAPAVVPPIVLRSQLYSVLRDRTQVDRELDALRRRNEVRVFELAAAIRDVGIMMTRDYIAFVRRCRQTNGAKSSPAIVQVLEWFEHNVLPRCADCTIAHTDLLSLLSQPLPRACKPQPPHNCQPSDAVLRQSVLSSPSSRGGLKFRQHSIGMGHVPPSAGAKHTAATTTARKPASACLKTVQVKPGTLKRAASQPPLSAQRKRSTALRGSLLTMSDIKEHEELLLASLSDAQQLTSSRSAPPTTTTASKQPSKGDTGSLRIGSSVTSLWRQKKPGMADNGGSPAGSGSTNTVTEQHVSFLIQCGLLLRHPKVRGMHVFSVPGLGRVVKSVIDGRGEMQRWFKKKPFNEMRRADVEQIKLHRSLLGWKFHVRDALGSGMLSRIQAPSGVLYKLVSHSS